MFKVLVKINCPHCASGKIKKNGVKRTGKQNFYCHTCKKQFQMEYDYQGADPLIKTKICKMAMCASGLRDTAKVLIISINTVVATLKKWFSTIPEPQFQGCFERVALDEVWSWVGKRKAQKRWIWYAYCLDTRKVLGFYIGKRDDAACAQLLHKISHLSIQHFFTDSWSSYAKLLPPQKHTISKRFTQKIERNNLNLRTHIKRLTRKTICFSKKDDMHYGFLKAYFHLANSS